MTTRRKTMLTLALLVLGAASLVFGIYRNEAEVVWNKASNICLECIGIG